MRGTEAQSIHTHEQNLLLAEQHLARGELHFDDLDLLLPGHLHTHRLEDLSLLRMGASGCAYLGASEQELIGMGLQFLDDYFDPLTQPLEHSRALTFFQTANELEVYGHSDRVRREPCASTYSWFLTFGKRSAHLGGIMMVSYPIDCIAPLADRLAKTLDDNEFLRAHHQKFASLTKREIEVLRLVALGHSRRDIAGRLFISIHTLDTHRKNIREKLELRSYRDLMRYAEAFGLLLEARTTDA